MLSPNRVLWIRGGHPGATDATRRDPAAGTPTARPCPPPPPLSACPPLAGPSATLYPRPRSYVPRFKRSIRGWIPGWAAAVVTVVQAKEAVCPLLSYDGILKLRVEEMTTGDIRIPDVYGWAPTLAIAWVKWYMVTMLFQVLLAPHRGQGEDVWYQRAVIANFAFFFAGVCGTLTDARLKDNYGVRTGDVAVAIAVVLVLSPAISYILLVSWRRVPCPPRPHRGDPWSGPRPAQPLPPPQLCKVPLLTRPAPVCACAAGRAGT